MKTPYVETNCIFEHNGMKFESGGAIVTPDQIIAYPKENGILGNWHGEPIGTWRVVSSWRIPSSFVSDRMYQIEAVVNGITYTGRGCGVGMSYKGKRKTRRRP